MAFSMTPCGGGHQGGNRNKDPRFVCWEVVLSETKRVDC